MKELFIKVFNEFETDARKFDLDTIKKGYPFHVLFFDSKGLLAFKLERRLVTKMGTILYPPLAKIIAEDKYQDVRREYRITGELTVGEVAAIDRIVTELRSPKPRGGVKRRPDHYGEIAEIELERKRSSETSKVTIQADLYIGDHEKGPFFLEIKSPRPNLDVCAESKRKMLIFQALYRPRKPQAFLGLPYNPFAPSMYAHSFTKQVMDMENEVLLGESLWNKLGGEDTYNIILEVINKVKLGKGN